MPDTSHSRPSTPPPELTIQGHTDDIFCAAFSSDGRRIASGSKDRTIRVWDAQTGNAVPGPPKMHTNGVWCVTFSPDGKQIASCSGDNMVLLWHVMTGNVVAGLFKGHFGLSVSPLTANELAQVLLTRPFGYWMHRQGTYS